MAGTRLTFRGKAPAFRSDNSRSRPTRCNGPDDPQVVDVTSEDDILRWSHEWIALLDETPRASFFNGPEWAAAWWTTVGQRAPTRLARWDDEEGQLVAVAHASRQSERLSDRLPLTLPVITMLGAGPGAADHLAFPCRDEYRERVWTWFDNQRGRVPAVLDNLDVRDGAPPLPSTARRIGSQSCPTMPLPAEIRSSLAKKIRTYSNRLDREGITITSHPPGSVNPEILRRFDDLQQQRRAAQGRTSMLEDEHVSLLEAITRHSSGSRGLAAVTAHRAERLVGVLLGFATAKRFEFYQIGWDPAVRNLSVGTVLIDRAIHDAEERGAVEFDFLRGEESYKLRFGAVSVEDEHWTIPTGPTGWVLTARDFVTEHRGKNEPAGANDE